MDALFIAFIVLAPWSIPFIVKYLIRRKEEKRIRDWEILSQSVEPRILVHASANLDNATHSSVRHTDDLYLKRLSGNLFGGHLIEGDVSCYTYSNQNRNVVLEYAFKSKPKVLNINISVIQKFWLRLLNQPGENRPDEVKVELPSFDIRFRIHSNQPVIAARFLNYPEIMKEFSKLHRFDRFEIYKGSAIYTIHNPQDNGFFQSEYANTFTHLLRILEIYEGQIVDLVISELHSYDNICPFCREKLNSERDVIVTCKLCRTRHHQSCITENKLCTTWGCSATAQDFI